MAGALLVPSRAPMSGSFEKIVELRTRHLELLRVSVDPFGKGGILCGSPASLEFSAVLTLLV